MAKQAVDLSKLTLGAARPVVKKAPADEKPAVEKAVEAIHEQPAEPPKATEKAAAAPAKRAEKAAPAPKEKMLGKRGRPVIPRHEEVVRVSVDLPKSLYKRVKLKVVQQEITLFEYFAKLAEADLAAKR